MQIYNNYNINKTQPAFGHIDIGAARETLNKTLKSKYFDEYYKIIENNYRNKLVDITLIGRGKKLDANISSLSACKDDGSYFYKSISQRFFESTIHFIRRCDKTAKKMTTKVNEQLARKEALSDEKLDEICCPKH